MAIFQSNISAISNCIANQGIKLIVRVEAAGSRVVAYLHALVFGVQHLARTMRMSSWHGPSTTWGTSYVPATVGSFVVTKLRQRQQILDARCRTLA